MVVHVSVDENIVTEPSDNELIAQFRSGNESAYNELVRRHHGRIYGLVYNMTGNREDAQDMTQEVFLRAYKALNRFQGKSAFSTWIYRIAVNRTINFLKKRKNRYALSLDDADMGLERDPAFLEASEQIGPDGKLKLSEFQEKLNKALLTLSEKHRTVVVMHDIQGVSHDEIAQVMKCSSGTVRSRLFYARRQLQAELSEFAP